MPNKERIKCYFGCINDGPLHQFPNIRSGKSEEIERFESWKAVLDPSLKEKGNTYIYYNVWICFEHFEPRFRTSSRRLTRTAVPTLKLSKSGQMDVRHSTPCQHKGQVDVPVNPTFMDVTPSTSKMTCIQPKHNIDATPMDVEPTTANRCSVKLQQNEFGLRKIPKKQTLIAKLTRMSEKCKTLRKGIKMAQKLSLKKSFLKMTEKLPKDIQIFTNLQLKCGLKPRGRRFSTDEKIMALTIFKQSPKAYKLLKKMFVLPAKRTLQNVMSTFSVKPGINENIIKNLKQVVKKMPEEKKIINLLFDEVSLAPGIVFNKKQGNIVGFEDFGTKRNKTLADHALVFMIKGIKTKCKQPICFTFCKSATKYTELKNILTQIIKDLHEIGFTVISTICDQSATNVKVIKRLQEETRIKYLERGEIYYSLSFEIDNIKIFPLFDTPHLLKGVRNNLLCKNARFVQNGETKWAKWEHLKILFDTDEGDDEIRLINKLTEMHVIKDKIPKMKVKYAAQVFSQRVSSAMRFLAKHKIIPEECQHTADFLLLFDKLFDSFNGHSYEDNSKAYKSCLKNNSPHFQIRNDLLPILETIKFQSTIKKGDLITTKFESIPSIKNWIQNIKVFREMWQYLNSNHNVKNLLTRNFNQDPLEIFFSSIRSNGVRNVNPTCNQFINSYKTLIINNFTSPHSPGANCEEDSNNPIQTLTNLINNKNDDSSPIDDFTCQVDSLIEIMNQIKQNDVLIHTESKKYVTGYVIKKCKSKIFKSCSSCMRDLCRSEVDLQSFNYEVDYTKKSLFHPSEGFVNLMNDIYCIIVACLRDFPESLNLYEKIRYILNCAGNYNIITCKKHKNALIDFIDDLAISLIIHSWCTGVNRILTGKINKFDYNDTIKKQAYDNYKKRIKR